MKSYKEVLNDAVNSSSLRKLTDEESKALKKCILEIYDQLDALCQENHLCLMLTGGSCLGAVRHNGFIPWDDDIDLMMPREDYEKLLDLLDAGALNEGYDFTCPVTKKDSPFLWMKIYKKGTLLVDVEGKYPGAPNGCSVDIFPIEGVPSANLVRKLKGYVANTIRLIANMVYDAKVSESSLIMNLYSKSPYLKWMMTVRRLLGRMFSIISHQSWVSLYDKYVRDLSMDKYVGIPTGRGLYYRESHPASVFFPPQDGIFEGRKVQLPADTDAYLTRLYHNYMQIPPEEKRESHFIVKLELPEQYFK